MTGGSREIGAAVLGATGYVGGEFLRLLAGHPVFALRAAVSESRCGEPVGSAFPHLADVMKGVAFAAPGNWIGQADRGSKLALFSAAPHGASASLVDDALEAAARRNLDVHVVDCSADFRYADPQQYQEVYSVPHAAPGLLDAFTCALPEHAAVNSRHIGHPGCFATAILLAAVPLVQSGLLAGPLFVSAVTGSTGSGKSAQPGTHHPERHANLYAYKALQHRHTPEISRLISNATGKSTAIHFVPHSGPFSRGIYATLQAQLVGTADAATIRGVFRSCYDGAPFVRIVDGAPRLKDVVASNYCRIGIASGAGAVVVMAAIDNLVKGAAGGAMQWMNRLWSLPETSGLTAPASAWA